jgi:hypothetical protein
MNYERGMTSHELPLKPSVKAVAETLRGTALIFCPVCGKAVPWRERYQHDCARRWLRAQGIVTTDPVSYEL